MWTFLLCWFDLRTQRGLLAVFICRFNFTIFLCRDKGFKGGSGQVWAKQNRKWQETLAQTDTTNTKIEFVYFCTAHMRLLALIHTFTPLKQAVSAENTVWGLWGTPCNTINLFVDVCTNSCSSFYIELPISVVVVLTKYLMVFWKWDQCWYIFLIYLHYLLHF